MVDYRIGDRFIIEIGDTCVHESDPTKKLYCAKGFNTLTFDERGLNKLCMLDEDVYQRQGIELMWAVVKKEFINGRLLELIESSEDGFEFLNKSEMPQRVIPNVGEYVRVEGAVGEVIESSSDYVCVKIPTNNTPPSDIEDVSEDLVVESENADMEEEV